ncbi:MAG: Ldh family oxidoreductase [Algicola sp.]|nr:Ldh family oxidoreductase [Algicola sp.]
MHKTVDVELINTALAKRLQPFDLSAQSIADVQYGLTEASLRGIDTHGVRLLDCYLKELAGGRANPIPEFKLHQRMPSAATLDADGSLGIVAGMHAMRCAVDTAKTQGIAAVAVKNSNHYGAASIYTLYAVKQGMIGLTFSNTDALIAPFNGIEAMLGTNPISMAAPGANGDIFCLDMACSQVAYSKVKYLMAQGEPVDETCMHTSPNDGQVGALKGVGGYKGMGLTLMVQILTAILTGSLMDHQMSHLYEEPYDQPRQVSHFMIAINIAAFISPDAFESSLSALFKSIRDSTRADPDVSILVPGDLEQQQYRQRTTEGIPLSPAEYQLLFE